MRRPSVEFLPPALARDAQRVARRLEEAGHRTWLVGGAPRDLALDRPVADADLATDATPDEIEALFEISHAVGRAFGTVVLPGEAGPVEVTTFRVESGYADGRRPEEVEFTRDIVQDAARRDFTANALYLDPLTDELADPMNGLADLEAGVLRAVGDAAARFAEDGLRIIRLARFAAVLGFRMEPVTAEAARRGLDNLRGVSPERVVTEWVKAERHGVVPAFATNLDVLDALFVPHPALVAGLDGAGVDDRARRARALANLPAQSSAELALAVLHAPNRAFDAARAEVALRALNVSRSALNRALTLWKSLAQLTEAPEQPRAREWRHVARPTFEEDLLVAELLECVEPAVVARWRAWAASRPSGDLLPDALLEAKDLLALGIAPGPEVGRLLRGLVDAQLEGRVTDKAGARAWVAAERRG